MHHADTKHMSSQWHIKAYHHSRGSVCEDAGLEQSGNRYCHHHLFLARHHKGSYNMHHVLYLDTP